MKYSTITFDYVSELFSYEPDTGKIYWKIKRKGCRQFDEAGGVTAVGYRAIKIDGHQFLSHRIVWLFEHGELPAGDIDHKDRIRLNNHISNLQIADSLLNQRNCKLSALNTSGITGVVWRKDVKKWWARIAYDGIRYNLGFFPLFEDAVKAREKANIKYHNSNGLEPGTYTINIGTTYE